MAAVKDIITHVTVEVASSKRICHRNRNNHSIAKDESCLAVYDANGGRKNYCLPCGAEILDKAKAKIATLERELKVIQRG
jgi:hypothetical protein